MRLIVAALFSATYAFAGQPISSDETRELSEAWLATELAGDEGARVRVFINCEVIDQSEYCGTSPAQETVLLVERQSLSSAFRGAHADITVRVVGKFENPLRAHVARQLVPQSDTKTFRVESVRTPKGLRLASRLPRLVDVCSAKQWLEYELSRIDDLRRAYWGPMLIQALQEEHAAVSQLPAAMGCPPYGTDGDNR